MHECDPTTPDDVDGRLLRSVDVSLMAGVVYTAMVWLTTQVESVRAVSHWQDDPPDAFASIGVQVVVVVGAITFVRLLRSTGESTLPSAAALFLLRGAGTILTVVWLSVIADAIAQVTQLGERYSGALAAVPPAALAVTAIPLILATVLVTRSWQETRGELPTGQQAEGADALDDIAVVTRRFHAMITPRWPRFGTRLEAVWAWGPRVSRRFPWLNPRRHPWRACLVVAVAAGFALAAAHGMAEGPSLTDGSSIGDVLFVGAIFVAIESVAVLLAFAVLNRWLGLIGRPRSAVGVGGRVPG